MISTVRIQKLLKVLAPYIADLEKAERHVLIKEIESVLGYDAEKASRIRQLARERDNVVQELSMIGIK